MDYKLSHSQLEVMKSCQRKYYHKYVLKTPVDEDYNPSRKALDYGSLVHYFASSYIKGDLLKTDIYQFVTHDAKQLVFNDEHSCLYDDENEEMLGKACASCHFAAQFVDDIINQGGEFIVSELRYETPFSTAIIDCIIKLNDVYYVVDFKTATIKNGEIPELGKIATDPQLNLYAYFFSDIMEKLGVKDARLGGVAWCQIHKSALKYTKKANTIDDLYQRIVDESETPYRVISTRAEHLKSKEFVDNFNQLAIQADMLRNSKEEPAANFSACMGFFGSEPCPYWSRCHGSLYSNPIGCVGFPDDGLLNEWNF
jgi:hypothetical protein